MRRHAARWSRPWPLMQLGTSSFFTHGSTHNFVKTVTAAWSITSRLLRALSTMWARSQKIQLPGTLNAIRIVLLTVQAHQWNRHR